MGFPNVIERDVPQGKPVHVILDNCAAHKHSRVMAWLGRHPRFVFHFTATSCSWLNAVEGFFADLLAAVLGAGRREHAADLADRRAFDPEATGLVEEAANLRGHVAEPGGCAEDDALIVRQLRRHGVPERPADLQRHACLGYAYQASGDVWHIGAPARRVAVRTSGRIRANYGAVLRRAALDGLGLALLPTFIVGEDLKEGRLVPLFWEVAGERAVYAVYPHARNMVPKVRAFVDFLAECFGPRPYWDDAAAARRGTAKGLVPAGTHDMRDGAWNPEANPG
jgi:hypothetical protein